MVDKPCLGACRDPQTPEASQRGDAEAALGCGLLSDQTTISKLIQQGKLERNNLRIDGRSYGVGWFSNPMMI